MLRIEQPRSEPALLRAVHHGDVGPPGRGSDDQVLELAVLAAGLDDGVERRVELEPHVERGRVEGREQQHALLRVVQR